jgi:hypothetical protein
MTRKSAEKLAWAMKRRLKIPPRIIRIGRGWAAYMDNDVTGDQVDGVMRMCRLLVSVCKPTLRPQVYCRYGDSMGLPVFELDSETKYPVIDVEFTPMS